MPSEKMRYWDARHPHTIHFQDSGLEKLAMERLATSSPGQLVQLVNALITQNQSNIFTMISHCLELGPDHLRIVLNAAIEHEKGDDETLLDCSESLIQEMIDPVLERAKRLAAEGRLVEAVEPVLVALVIIEHEMQYVYDEGWVLQMVVEDCFKTVMEIAKYEYPVNVAKELKALCVRYNRQRSENNDNYDDEWNDISDALAKG